MPWFKALAMQQHSSWAAFKMTDLSCDAGNITERMYLKCIEHSKALH